MSTLKNVLVATDFGMASETALAYGRDLARTFNARVPQQRSISLLF